MFSASTRACPNPEGGGGGTEDGVHYCIFCGSEGPRGSLCQPHMHCRGACRTRPLWSMASFGTFMGRKLTYVSFPWAGDPEAPYVFAPGELRKKSWPGREYVSWRQHSFDETAK